LFFCAAFLLHSNVQGGGGEEKLKTREMKRERWDIIKRGQTAEVGVAVEGSEQSHTIAVDAVAQRLEITKGPAAISPARTRIYSAHTYIHRMQQYARSTMRCMCIHSLRAGMSEHRNRRRALSCEEVQLPGCWARLWRIRTGRQEGRRSPAF